MAIHSTKEIKVICPRRCNRYVLVSLLLLAVAHYGCIGSEGGGSDSNSASDEELRQCMEGLWYFDFKGTCSCIGTNPQPECSEDDCAAHNYLWLGGEGRAYEGTLLVSEQASSFSTVPAADEWRLVDGRILLGDEADEAWEVSCSEAELQLGTGRLYQRTPDAWERAFTMALEEEGEDGWHGYPIEQ
jgi:hypothetical protein